MKTRTLQDGLSKAITNLDKILKNNPDGHPDMTEIIQARKQDLLNAMYALDELRIFGLIK